MLILALDTSANFVSVALLDETRVFAFTEEVMERGQAETLIPKIQYVLEQSHLTMRDVQGIAVSTGPGSFTGVRIGLACARALGLALNVPVYGVTCFEAWNYHLNRPVKVVLETKRGDYFVQSFDQNGIATDEPAILSADRLRALLPFAAVGTGAEQLKQEISCESIVKISPTSVAIGRIALSRTDNPKPPVPLYMREADVTI